MRYLALMTIASSLGGRVRALRVGRGWTLDEAASRLEISRRSLVQVEGGESNPSLSTLLSIAQGFEVELTELLESHPTAARLVATECARTLWSTKAGSRGDLCVGLGPMEMWRFELLPGEGRTSAAHGAGSLETVHVLSGTLSVRAGSEQVVLAESTSVAFYADENHEYRNDGTERAEFLLAVYDPSATPTKGLPS